MLVHRHALPVHGAFHCTLPCAFPCVSPMFLEQILLHFPLRLRFLLVAMLCLLIAHFIVFFLAPFFVLQTFPLFLFVTALFRRHCKFFFQIVGCNAIFMTYRLTSHNSLCYFWYRKKDGCAYHYKHCLWMRMKDLRNSRIITNNNGYQV